MSHERPAEVLAKDVIEWRRDFHAHPELLYELPRTSGIVAERLRSFGCDKVVTGIGRSGVVASIKGRELDNGRVIGLRADMDALPILEKTGKPYASTTPGMMHACGHDGHTAMLLGAARQLCNTRNFRGTAVLIFQPAEEGGAGAKAMLDDGLIERFGVEEIYGLHNMPGLALGKFGIRPGPIMASADWIDIEIIGKGGHAAKPHQCVDPIAVAGHLITAVQMIAARATSPLDPVVVSLTGIHGGGSYNVIPETAGLRGTVRTLDPGLRLRVEEHLRSTVTSVAAAFGAEANLTYRKDYPVTVNSRVETEHAIEIASEIAGATGVDRDYPPELGSEDFAFFLEQIPGAFIFAGIGETAAHHQPEYDFNDELIPLGIQYWTRLVEKRLS